VTSPISPSNFEGVSRAARRGSLYQILADLLPSSLTFHSYFPANRQSNIPRWLGQGVEKLSVRKSGWKIIFAAKKMISSETLLRAFLPEWLFGL